MANQELCFEITKQEQLQLPQQFVTGRLGEGGLKAVTVKVLSNQLPYDLTGLSGKFLGMKADGNRIIDDSGFLILDAHQGVFRYIFPQEAFTFEGAYQEAFFKLYRGDQCETTLSLEINVLANKIEMGINSSEYISDYEQLIKALNEKTEEFLEALTAKENNFESQVKVIQGQVQNIQDAINNLEEKIKSDDLVTSKMLEDALAPYDMMVSYDPNQSTLV
ncbi:phage baseplate upper protein [Lactococcus garvieae subsp. garvieae]|uniref:phage baseplate upper protein n=1 Tax=Lactococcus garvieae TaxID=1363 RepID=UPI0005A6C479|nr:phage baseplate upper protein [Lactococcus garvieae]KAA8718827.1 phage baseplate upper protein [Lactococcus garvieae subsp. garvieae]MDG6191132.1 phage baseplate upper protein [Lactococcus garvieae]PCS00284.1 prophage P1 protein 54, minor head protein [Lactococcus garvieae]QPR48970.1 phage baseplate upper protein [Lactococcus garvieae]